MARLLVCYPCATAMKMRDYEGDVSNDWELHEMVKRHLGKAADPRPEAHGSQLYGIPDEDLALMNDAQLKEALKSDLDREISEIRDDYKDQAMQCFDLHARPKGTCRDWKEDHRVIGQKAGVPKDERAYLCDYCPVASTMQHLFREKKGLYKGTVIQ